MSDSSDNSSQADTNTSIIQGNIKRIEEEGKERINWGDDSVETDNESKFVRLANTYIDPDRVESFKARSITSAYKITIYTKGGNEINVTFEEEEHLEQAVDLLRLMKSREPTGRTPLP